MKGYFLTALGVTWLLFLAIVVIRADFAFGVYVPRWLPSWTAKTILSPLISILCLGWLVPLTMGIRSLRH